MPAGLLANMASDADTYLRSAFADMARASGYKEEGSALPRHAATRWQHAGVNQLALELGGRTGCATGALHATLSDVLNCYARRRPVALPRAFAIGALESMS